jgi:polar amino acid transport system substrate-binding protein
MQYPHWTKLHPSMAAKTRGSAGTAFLLALLQWSCTSSAQTQGESGPAPIDTTAPSPVPIDTVAAPDTSVATPPITPPPTTVPQDTPPPGAQQQGAQEGVSQLEYEGWRQYSVQCARCHGQDVLPNPVAANLLVSTAPGGPVASKEKFVQVVTEGREERGMPAFKAIMTPAQIEAVYAYVKGRAEKRIPPGRPSAPPG